jgi:hypothetical protein
MTFDEEVRTAITSARALVTALEAIADGGPVDEASLRVLGNTVANAANRVLAKAWTRTESPTR